MPLYEYTCESCHADFEALVRGQERPACPKCGNTRLTKRLSVPAAHTGASSQLPVCEPGGGCGLPQCGAGGCGLGF
jgi:putative FmdB family regulatory protein